MDGTHMEHPIINCYVLPMGTFTQLLLLVRREGKIDTGCYPSEKVKTTFSICRQRGFMLSRLCTHPCCEFSRGKSVGSLTLSGVAVPWPCLIYTTEFSPMALIIIIIRFSPIFGLCVVL